MDAPQPLFIGFRAKAVKAPSGFGVPEVCSMSDCVNDPTPEWSDKSRTWNHNRTGCYNTEEEAREHIPADRGDEFSMFAYRMFPLEFSTSGCKAVDLNERLGQGGTDIAPEPMLSGYEIIGYDVANGPIYEPEKFADQPPFNYGGSILFGCSPLSCNGYLCGFTVNKYYLLSDFDAAFEAGLIFGAEEPEPGPYFIYEVLRYLP